MMYYIVNEGVTQGDGLIHLLQLPVEFLVLGLPSPGVDRLLQQTLQVS
jgi:hypothetical protein